MRRNTRDTTGLAVAAAVNGVLAYVFFAVGTRALGPEATAPVSVLWAYWSFAAAALTFPLQHWVTRSVTALGGEGQVRAGISRIYLVVLMVSAAAGVVAWWLREPLFRRDDVWFPVLVALVTFGSAYVGIVRGTLAARRRYRSLAWSLVGEGSIRCGGALLLIAFSWSTSLTMGIVLVVGQLIGLAWPSTLRFSAAGTRDPGRSPIAFLGGTASGQLLGQLVLTGAPVLLALSGGAPRDVTALFAGLALFRAPYTIGLGVLPRLTTALTGLAVAGRHDELRRVQVRIITVTAAMLVPVAAGAAWLGPPLLRLVFGAEITLGAVDSSLLAVGSVLAMANLVVTITVIAQDRPGAMVRSWLLACAGGALAFGVLPQSDLHRTVTTFVVTELIAFVTLLAEDSRARGRHGERPAS